MKRIYKITPDLASPTLSVIPDVSGCLVGDSLIQLSPNKPFHGRLSTVSEWRQFYRVGVSGFAISESAWEHCMEMYYVITENDVELLSVEADEVDLRIINPRQILPASEDPNFLCDMRYVNSLFRIQGKLSEVFCFEGLAVADNEFKHCYEKFGFSGLVFEEVWRGEK